MLIITLIYLLGIITVGYLLIGILGIYSNRYIFFTFGAILWPITLLMLAGYIVYLFVTWRK